MILRHIHLQCLQAFLVLGALASFSAVNGQIPLVFPSLTDIGTLVYDDVTGALLPAQGAIPLFLCKAADEPFDLQILQSTCGDKVLFTKGDSVELTVMSLSDLGVIQPVPEPTIEKSVESVEVETQSIGPAGLIDPGQLLTAVPNLDGLEVTPGGARRLLLLPEEPATPAVDVGGLTGTPQEPAPTPGGPGPTPPPAEPSPGADVTGGLTEAAQNVPTGATDAVTGATETAAGGATETAQGAVDATTAGTQEAVTTATEAGQTAATTATESAQDATGTASDLAAGAVDQTQGAVEFVAAQTENLVETTAGQVFDLSTFNLAESFNAGQVPTDLALIVTLVVSNLPENELTTIEVIMGDSVRNVSIFRDTEAPQASVKQTSDLGNVNRRKPKKTEVEFEIGFSERVILPNPGVEGCAAASDRYGILSPDTLSVDGALGLLQAGPDLITDFLGATAECWIDLLDFDPEKLFTIEGADVLEAKFEAPSLSLATLGQAVNLSDVSANVPKIKIRANWDPRKYSEVKLGVPLGAMADFAGLLSLNPFIDIFNLFADLALLAAQTVGTMAETALESAQNLGTAATTAVGATIAATAATSIGASVAASASGAAITGGVGGSAAGSSMSGAVDLLNVGQKIFLTGNLAVQNLPENYQNFAEQMKWTMFDIKLPWEDDGSPQSFGSGQGGKQRRLLGFVQGSSEEFVLDADEPIDVVKRAFFWIAVFLAVLLVIHLIISVILLLYGIKIPPVLRFPRLELYFAYWAIPAIAAASAGLFTGSKGDKVLGAFLIIIFPVAFLVWQVFILWKHFYRRSPEHTKVSMVIEYDPEGEAKLVPKQGDPEMGADSSNGNQKPVEAVHREAEQEGEEEEKSGGCWGWCTNVYEKVDGFMERFVYTPILGPPYEEGIWYAPSGPRSMFFNRYGPIFEDFRGQPMTVRNATLVYNKESGRIERGEVQIVKASRAWEHSRIGHWIQLSGKVIEIFKLVFIACLIAGEDDPNSLGQAIALLTVTIIYLIMLRIFRPPMARWDLGMSMIGEVGDILTFIFAIIVLQSSESNDSDFRRSVGIALLCFQGFAFFATFLDNFFMIAELIGTVIQAFKERGKPPKMYDIALAAQLQNPAYLERKYFNRWMKRTVGRGVHTGVVKRGHAPMEEILFAQARGRRPHSRTSSGNVSMGRQGDAKGYGGK